MQILRRHSRAYLGEHVIDCASETAKQMIWSLKFIDSIWFITLPIIPLQIFHKVDQLDQNTSYFYVYIYILIIINICSIFLYMSHISSWNIIMTWGKPPATFHLLSSWRSRPTGFSAAPKLFFRVMELIPTSAGPWHGDTNMGCFFSPNKNMGI